MSHVFMSVLSMSLTASFVALIIIAVRFVLNKCRLPKIFSYALWAVVFVRLVMPVSFESGFSLIPEQAQKIVQPEVSSLSSVPITLPDSTATELSVVPVHELAPTQVTIKTPMLDFQQIGTVIWLAGIAVMLLYALTTYVRLRSRLQFATRLRNNIYETDQIESPFVHGLIKPRIYVPVGLGEEDLTYILKHEQTHIRRYDHFIKPVAFFVLALHWFNPLIWLSYYLMVKDMEMSCDEKVIKQTKGDARAGYSRTLLALAVKQSRLLGPLSFGESNVKERVENVLYYKRPAFWVGTIGAAVLVILAVSLLLNPLSSGESSADEQAVTDVVQQFGEKLQLVTLSDPQQVVSDQMRTHYGEYVTVQLIEKWSSDPEHAPGRLTSSPWPDRIEVLDVDRLADDKYEVSGSIVEVTTDGSVAGSRSIVLGIIKQDGQWKINSSMLGEYEAGDHVTDIQRTPQVLAGYITLQDDMLYVDPVEIVTTEFGDQLTGLDLYDPERIAELGLSEERDFPNGYYIYNPDQESVTYHLTEDTQYLFTDVELMFLENESDDRRYMTNQRSEFIEHLTTSIRDFAGEVPYPVLIEVHDQDVVRVEELFLLTQ